MFLLLYPESREQLGRKRQVQETAPGPGSPYQDPRTWLRFPWSQTQIPRLPKASACPWTLLLFLPQVRWQQIDYPDDSIEGICGAGWGRFHPDVASDGLAQTQVAPWFPTSPFWRLS